MRVFSKDKPDLRICLLGGSLETSNRGVSALVSGACSLMNQYLAPCRITLLTPSRSIADQRTVLGFEGPLIVRQLFFCRGPSKGLRNSVVFALVCAITLRLVPIKRLRQVLIDAVPLLRVMQQSDVVTDLFLGDSFSDIYGLRRFGFRMALRWCAVLVASKYVLLPQTYGPFRHPLSRLAARSILNRADIVFTRTADDRALSTLRLKRSFRSIYCPDVACVVAPDPAGMALVSGGPDHSLHTGGAVRSPLIVGINVSGLLYNGGYTGRNMFNLKLDYPTFVPRLIESLLAIDTVRVVLVPHTYQTFDLDHVENDLGACLRVASLFQPPPQRLKVIDQDLDQHQIKGVIGACDVFLGSRFHACVAALSQGIVTLGIGYSKKFAEGFAAFDAEELVIDARVTDADGAIATVHRVIGDRDAYRDRVRTGSQTARNTAHKCFALLGAALRGTASTIETAANTAETSDETDACLKI